MKDSEILAEIAEIIDRMTGNGQPAPASWIIQAVITNHAGIEGTDKEFYSCCAQGHVGHCVRQVLRREKADEEREDAQLLLPGFKHLHRRYSVLRAGEQAIVPVEQMTAAEVREKAGEYRRMARGLDEHADELLRYAERHANAAA